ncbi:hypothetical protein HA466_0270790 [Hirschfeldia incana]|nr:hypothetical protein HA466_0270790 [Hirschfeldia incana]
MKEDVSKDSAVTEEAKAEEVLESIPQQRTWRSLDVINVNKTDVPEKVFIKDIKFQKKPENTTKPRTKKVQEETKKSNK